MANETFYGDGLCFIVSIYLSVVIKLNATIDYPIVQDICKSTDIKYYGKCTLMLLYILKLESNINNKCGCLQGLQIGRKDF